MIRSFADPETQRGWRGERGRRSEARTMSGSRITTGDEGRLGSFHPGEVLRHDILVGSQIALEDVAGGSGVCVLRPGDLLDRRVSVGAATELRLARCLGVSEGVFFGLQHDRDMDEARRALMDELGRITPRAARLTRRSKLTKFPKHHKTVL